MDEPSNSISIPSSPLLLSVILPIYNEEKVLRESLRRFAEQFDSLVGVGRWQYVLVENGSKDGSAAVVRELVARWPGSVALFLKRPNIGNSLREGMLAATGEWSLILNVDHVWDPPFFHWAWGNRQNYDMILGSKRADPTLNEQARYRLILSAGLNAALHGFLGFVGADSHGMKLMKTESVKPLAQVCRLRRGQFDTELTLRALREGLWVAEAPVPYAEKRPARNWMIKKILQNVVDLFTLYSTMKSVPYRSRVNYRRVCRADLLEAPNRSEGRDEALTVSSAHY